MKALNITSIQELILFSYEGMKPCKQISREFHAKEIHEKTIFTSNGVKMIAFVGDYVIKDKAGNLFVCAKEDFFNEYKWTET